jgi:NitT/TauT family transport system ATP-binding protein
MTGRDLGVAATPSIRFSEVTKTFGEGAAAVCALHRVSFDIAIHEFVSVLGPSGCGKSTVLRLISGLTKPTRGSVTVFGHPLQEPRDDVGLMFQQPTLLPWLNTLANVTFPLKHKYGEVSAADRDRARALLETVGLKDFAAKRIDELSGGMQQRVALARA